MGLSVNNTLSLNARHVAILEFAKQLIESDRINVIVPISKRQVTAQTPQIDHKLLAKELAHQVWGDDPPGTLVGIREVIRMGREDRKMDEETAAFLVRNENKIDRILELLEDDTPPAQAGHTER